MTTTIIMHIGLHKTGTSSFQNYMRNNRGALLKADADVYQPFNNPKASTQLGIAICRDGVLDRVPIGLADRVRPDIADFIARSTAKRLVFSDESMSLIRTVDEALALRRLFPENKDLHFKVVVVLREKKAWFASYRNQILKMNAENKTDPRAAFYLDPDGWLTDFDQLLHVFRVVFDEVAVLDYDSTDIIAPLFAAMAIELGHPIKWYRLNPSVRNPERLRIIKKAFVRLFGNKRGGFVRWSIDRGRIIRSWVIWNNKEK